MRATCSTRSSTPSPATRRPRARLAQAAERIELVGQDERPPAGDLAVLDADAEQEQVVAQIAAGNSLVVNTLPGTGATQTIVNALGALVAQHKRVLVVSPRHATLRAVAGRLGDAGLGGIAVSPRTHPARPHPLDHPQREGRTARDRRGRRRPRAAAHGAARLPLRARPARPAPAGERARRARRAVPARAAAESARHHRPALHPRHGGARDGPGAGAVRPCSGPLRSASSGTDRATRPGTARSFASAEAAEHAHVLAKRLAATDVPRLLERAGDVIASTRLRPFETIAELGIYLRLLLDIRETLDKFLPAVFDRSLGELIVATGPRRDAREMSSVEPAPPEEAREGVRAARRARRRPARVAHPHPAAAHALPALRHERRHARRAGRHRGPLDRVPARRGRPHARSTSRSGSGTRPTACCRSRSSCCPIA